MTHINLGRCSTLSIEIDSGRVSAANQHTDALARPGYISPGDERRHSRRAAGFRDDPQRLPQASLSFPNRVVRYQHGAVDMAPDDGKYQLADSPRRQRGRGNSPRLGIDGPPRLERAGERRGFFRFHADDLDASLVPSRNPGDQAAAADRDQQRGEMSGLTLQLQTDRTLTEQGLDLVEGVNRHRPGAGHPRFARSESFRIALAADDQVCAIVGDLLNFGGRSG